jgi:flavin-dependent thymidylate synthase
METPEWLRDHRWDRRHHLGRGPEYSRSIVSPHPHKERFLEDNSFNSHEKNDGTHVSPYDNGRVYAGLDGLEVRLIQGVDEGNLKRVLSRTLRATTGISPDEKVRPDEWEEMMRGGLQSALESQVIVFEVHNASRALTHQLVRTRKAAFHQQSQRATWYGDHPDARWPESIVNPPEGRTEEALLLFDAWQQAQLAAWRAYRMACHAGISYQDARFILPEGTVNYIICEYSLREFINVYAYRACSMFMWEMVGVMRKMGKLLVEAHPFLEPYIKISCEKGSLCNLCKGSGYVWEDGVAADPDEVRAYLATVDDPDAVWAVNDQRIEQCPECKGNGSRERKCTFQGWENVEGQCDFPWAKQTNRVFLPTPRYRIGK